MFKTKVVILVVIIVVSFAIYFFNSLNSSVNGDKPVYFTIKAGQGLSKIADNLKKENLIKNKLIFLVYAKLSGNQAKLLAGEHLLNQNMNVKEILNVLVSGQSVGNEKIITIIEGWTAEEIGDYLETQKIVAKADFMKAIETNKWKYKGKDINYAFLTEVSAKTVEGFLFPDTYRIFTDATAEDVVQKMLDNFDQKLTNSMRAEIKNQKKSIFEIVTLASIVEREVRSDQDKKMIADIFWKRVEAGIALQSDATVNYITEKGRAQPTLDDLKIDSPYNTYKYRGLPPGPISNQGIGSIEAVIYPTKNPYYYFLTTIDDGRVIYGKTYEEHLANKAKYLK